jgi:hypothetical protein
VKRSIAAGAVAALAILVAIPTFAAAAQKKPKKPAAKKAGWAVCREHPILHISPPLNFEAPHQASFNVSDVLESCSSSDPTIDRGIANIRARTTSGGASCNGGALDGVARIRWNNGRTTRVNFHASFAGGFASAAGHIVGGSEFVGKSFAALDHLLVDQVAIQLCSTPSVGLSTLASDGDIAIGAPPSGGVVWTP